MIILSDSDLRHIGEGSHDSIYEKLGRMSSTSTAPPVPISPSGPRTPAKSPSSATSTAGTPRPIL